MELDTLVNRPWPECSKKYTWWRFKKYIGRNCRLHRWRGRKTCLQAFLDEVGILQVFSLWVVQLMLADDSIRFQPGKYVFFISDWEWDKFLSHKMKRLRIRNKQNVASCCDLHNHPKNSFGCKGTIFNGGVI